MGFTARSDEVRPVKARLVVVAEVVVARPRVSPLTKVEDAAVQMLAASRSSAIVPEVVMVPPVRPVPAVMEVTVPDPPLKHTPLIA